MTAAAEPDVSAWPGLRLRERLTDGHRSDVWRAVSPSGIVAVRRSRRSAASMAWELDLLVELDALGFVVPVPLATEAGDLRVDGVSVHRWIDGRPPTTEADWRKVASELQRLHAVTSGRTQRPGCHVVTELGPDDASVDAELACLPGEVRDLVLSVFGEFGDAPVAVIHGDPGPDNIRLGDDGRVGLLDWDESRIDVTWHDLSNLGIRVLDRETHERAQLLSHAWEAANAWIVEPEYARRRLRAVEAAVS